MFAVKHRWPVLLLIAALCACQDDKPVVPPAPTPPSAAQNFIDAFNKAEGGLPFEAQSTAQKCASTAAFVSCALVSANAPAQLTLILSLDPAGAIEGTTIEGAPDDDRLFAALSAIAAVNGEPLATTATIAAFRRDLGLERAPRMDKPAVAHRTYADITCVMKEATRYACTFAPTVTETDLPPPQLTSAKGTQR